MRDLPQCSDKKAVGPLFQPLGSEVNCTAMRESSPMLQVRKCRHRGVEVFDFGTKRVYVLHAGSYPINQFDQHRKA